MASLNRPYEQPVHWSELPEQEQIQFWEAYAAGDVSNFMVTPERNRKRTNRRRGEHSTSPKCKKPSWFRPERYKALPGQLGRVYNRLVQKNRETGAVSLRMHVSRHPIYASGRQRVGRTYKFRPEKENLLDALWPLLISYCDAGTHTVIISLSRLAYELSPKDEKGNLIPGMEVTVSRVSRLIEEQVRYGMLEVPKSQWDRENRQRLPLYVTITELAWLMLGADMVKLKQQQEVAIRNSTIRQQLIKEGVIGEEEEISVHAARKRWYEQRTMEAYRFRREKAAAMKRRKKLEPLAEDERIQILSELILKRMRPEEAYWCTPERLYKLAIEELYQLELALGTSPPH